MGMTNTNETRRKTPADSDLDRAVVWATAHPLEALERCGLDPSKGKREGAHLRFLCVAHAEETPSLTVTTEGKKRGLVKCFGCDLRGWFGLWRAARQLNGKTTRGEIVAFCRDMGQEVAESEERVYKILDADGHLLAEHHRVGDGPGKKVWWTREGSRGLGGLKTATLPLYRIGDVLTASPDAVLYVTEGEPKADALIERGVLACATCCGASTIPTTEALKPLKTFRRVVCWADRDEPGREHMRQIAARIGRNAEVVEWADGPEGGDAVDYLRAGGSVDSLPDALAPVGPQVDHTGLPPAATQTATTASGKVVVYTDYEELAPTIGGIRWAWRGWLPKGVVVSVGGEEEVGKSAFAERLCGSYTEGWEWPDGQPGPPERRPCIWIDGEGVEGQTLDRLTRWGMTPRMLKTLRAGETLDLYLDDPACQEAAEAVALETGAGLIVIDSLNACLKRVDENKPELRHALLAWAHMAGRLRIPILFLALARKRLSFEPPEFTNDRLRGHSVIKQLCRTIIGIDRPNEHSADSRARVTKQSFAKAKPPALGFRDTDRCLLVGDAPSAPDDAHEAERAAAWLRTYLAGGKQGAMDAMEAARNAGFSERTIERVKPGIAKSDKDGDRWYWSLK
jgi:hypothetical protein